MRGLSSPPPDPAYRQAVRVGVIMVQAKFKMQLHHPTDIELTLHSGLNTPVTSEEGCSDGPRSASSPGLQGSGLSFPQDPELYILPLRKAEFPVLHVMYGHVLRCLSCHG